MRVKICGITQPDQARSIAHLGATALGFVCVPSSPRYVLPEQIRAITDHLLALEEADFLPSAIDRVGVFAQSNVAEICQVVTLAHLTAVQLHGDESPQFCQSLRDALPQVELIKALRVRDRETIAQTEAYLPWIDTLLLDAYHPGLLGGTGQTLDWSALQSFRPPCAWFLAGGLTPDNVRLALQQVQPDGIDLSSGVEHRPGQKDLPQVARLFEQLRLERSIL